MLLMISTKGAGYVKIPTHDQHIYSQTHLVHFSLLLTKMPSFLYPIAPVFSFFFF
uniref:Uncharacterized protein n=1 Tax=Rhizophora mucronata TaxID=61149 RepID=A0A2P2ITF8_RHIMU